MSTASEHLTRAIGEIGGLLLLCACAAQQITNAPPEIVASCQREIAVLTEGGPIATTPEGDILRGSDTATPQDTIEDARVAKREASIESLADWPEEALMYRCLASRGVKLTPAQAEVLAEWNNR